MRLFALDPGPAESGWLLCETSPFAIHECGVFPNDALLSDFGHRRWPIDLLLIEKVESYGMAVGAEVFETVFASGRFAQAVLPTPFDRMGRKPVKLCLCGTVRATSANIRQALLDKFGGPTAIGKKKTPGPLYRVKSHAWAALALAVTYAETHPEVAHVDAAV